MTVLFSQLGLPEHARSLANLINDHDNRLSLEKLPADHPWLQGNPGKPYAVIHRPFHAPEYVVASYPEHLLDHRIFADIIAGDARTHNWDMEEFDPVYVAQNLLRARRRMDDKGAAQELMEWKMERRKWS
jgi:hypothetical protein